MYSSLTTYCILFGGVFALSTSAIFVKLAEAPSPVIAFYRLLIAGAVLLPFFLFRAQSRTEIKALRKTQWRQIVTAGAFLALHYVLWFESLSFTSTASSTVIVCLQPLFSLALERFLLQKKIKASALLGCAIALGGSAIIGFGDFQISGKSLLGDLMAFVAAGFIASYFFVGQSIRKELSAVTYSVLSYAVSAAVLLVYILILGEPFLGYSPPTWLAFIGLALISTIGGQFVFNLLLRKLPASAVTTSILGEPIGTCLLAYVILHETVSLQQLLGIVLILIGISIFFLLPRRQK